MPPQKVDKERARQLRRDGESLRTIAEVFGVTVERIRQVCRGVEPDPDRKPRLGRPPGGRSASAVGVDWTPEGEQINGWVEEGGKVQSPFLSHRCQCERPILDDSGYCTKCGKVRRLRIEVL